jgi:hypothetical protein
VFLSSFAGFWKGDEMKIYVFRDVFTGKIYKTLALTARDAKGKIARVKGLNPSNLAHVKPQSVAVPSLEN